MTNMVVIGATGDVGRGIVAELLRRGHNVAAVARNASRLAALRTELGAGPRLLAVPGSLADDGSAAALRVALMAALGTLDSVVVAVNAPRQPAPLAAHNSDQFAALIGGDLITHYTAARAFIPALADGGVYLGIGGGSCDFVLHEGVPQSVAQAALRMLYRGLAHEFRDQPVRIRELIIASVVNGVSTRSYADPSWVSDNEIGHQVAAIIAQPLQFPGPILRMARRDSSGQPVFSSEPPTKVQGFRQVAAL